MKVLFLTPWYPSEKDAMAGLFVQKHVEAVRAQGCDVRVIDATTWSGIWRAWRNLKREGWMPDIVQLNVIQKQGLLARYLKRRYKIPYVIIEHWSGFLPENGAYLRNNGPLKRKLYEHIATQASVIMPVSNRLKEAMQACGIQNARWEKICNVVDDFFYDHSENTKSNDGIKTILHVSCFDEQAKNVKGLLRAAKSLSEKRQDWRLVLVGTGIDYKEVRTYAEELEIPKTLLHWTGELTPQEVAKEMQKADVFVLSSNYETAGIVLTESLICGKPVITTPVGIAPDIISDEVGRIIPKRQPDKLAGTIDWMLDHYMDFNTEKMRSIGQQYSLENVGKQLKAIYESVL